MKKLVNVVMVLCLALSMGSVVSAQEPNLEERVSVLESQMQELMNKPKTEKNNSVADESTTGNFKIATEIPETLEEGWEFATIGYGYFDFVKIANVRYNDKFLFMDVELVNSIEIIEKPLLDAVYENFRVWQISDKQKEVNRDHLLKVQMKQTSSEMYSDLPLITASDVVPLKGGSVQVTLPFKLNSPIKEASKILLRFGDDQEVELTLQDF